MVPRDLYAPLPRRPVRRRSPVSAVASVTAGVFLLGLAGVAALRDDGNRGEPFAVGSIGTAVSRPIPPPPAATLPQLALTDTTPSLSNQSAPFSGLLAQMENGVMVVRAGTPGGPGPLTLKVPEPTPSRIAFKAPDPQLIESTATGPLPRIGADGSRPASAYAGPSVAAKGKPRIAILIGGMGLDRAATTQAAQLFPPGVTFGFAPYGSDLGEQVADARASGHEVVLQIPMEDFSRGDRPFPHMLKVEDAGDTRNLHWLMSRFAGYAGVGNYLGGKLLGNEAGLKPVLRDIAARGLYFVDDGTAPRSLGIPLSQDLGLPAAKADVVIDESSDPVAVSAALARLEQLARDHGFAMGTASVRPATNALIAHYLASAGERGIVVVPVGQAVGIVKSGASVQATR